MQWQYVLHSYDIPYLFTFKEIALVQAYAAASTNIKTLKSGEINHFVRFSLGHSQMRKQNHESNPVRSNRNKVTIASII
jgi:hypothetical protein